MKRLTDDTAASPPELLEMMAVLSAHGERFHGGDVEGTAQEWSNGAGMTADEADAWMEQGVWNAGVAFTLATEGFAPDVLRHVSPELLYKVCNGDLPIGSLLRAIGNHDAVRP